MPNGPLDAGSSNISKGDASTEKSNISGSGSSEEASRNLFAETMPTGSDAFGQKSDGKVDQQEQADITEKPQEVKKQAENQIEGSDAAEGAISVAAKDSGDSLQKCQQKAESLQDTEFADMPRQLGEHFGNDLKKTLDQSKSPKNDIDKAVEDVAKCMGEGKFAMAAKAAGSIVGTAAGKAGKAAVDTKKE